MEKKDNRTIINNGNNIYITFEQAEMLARKLNYKENVTMLMMQKQKS